MENQAPAATTLRRLAVVGNHLPRRCGIATFTTDLNRSIAEAAPDLQSFVVAMNDTDQHAYPAHVRLEIAEDDLAAYRRCAQALNTGGVELVLLQHEYGIFGGKCGGHVLTLLRELRMPVVTTLHTVLTSPSPLQRATLEAIIDASDRVVVMSEHGATTLRELHGTAASRIDVIPHGIPLAAEGTRGKAQLGLADQKVILTFGLLSPDKGVEYVIEALPAILEQHPNTVFVVLGATHPHVKERHGEAYRLELQTRVRRLQLDAHVVFHDRFVDDHELAEFLAAADIYVTPYLNPQQSTSGTLARAVAAGRAVISTPYWHARELLTEGRGLLVPVRDAPAIARAAADLLGDERARTELGKRAREHARASEWPVVARSYLRSFELALEARRSHGQRPHASGPLAQPADLPELNLEHLQAMTDDTGLLQHATFDVPRYQEGYCLDDNARALLLLTLLEETSGVRFKQSRSFSARYLAFVAFAFNRETGRFRNFMSYARHWLEAVGSEDSHARAVWALGTVAARSGEPNRQGLACELLRLALPPLREFTSPRAWAHGLLGINEYLRAFPEDAVALALRLVLVEKLCALYRHHASPDWPWFEDSLTYDNARLCQALIVSGEALGSAEVSGIGLRSLDWLAVAQRSVEGYFSPIGSNGFHSRGGVKAQFDQQPLEAAAMVSASLDALRVSGDSRWAHSGRSAFDWFLGQNHLGAPLYDAATGGCRDGLHRERSNENQGAESTLSFLMALHELRSADAAGRAGFVT